MNKAYVQFYDNILYLPPYILDKESIQLYILMEGMEVVLILLVSWESYRIQYALDLKPYILDNSYMVLIKNL